MENHRLFRPLCQIRLFYRDVACPFSMAAPSWKVARNAGKGLRPDVSLSVSAGQPKTALRTPAAPKMPFQETSLLTES